MTQKKQTENAGFDLNALIAFGTQQAAFNVSLTASEAKMFEDIVGKNNPELLAFLMSHPEIAQIAAGIPNLSIEILQMIMEEFYSYNKHGLVKESNPEICGSCQENHKPRKKKGDHEDSEGCEEGDSSDSVSFGYDDFSLSSDVGQELIEAPRRLFDGIIEVMQDTAISLLTPDPVTVDPASVSLPVPLRHADVAMDAVQPPVEEHLVAVELCAMGKEEQDQHFHPHASAPDLVHHRTIPPMAVPSAPVPGANEGVSVVASAISGDEEKQHFHANITPGMQHTHVEEETHGDHGH
jgi:hypothetical protein